MLGVAVATAAQAAHHARISPQDFARVVSIADATSVPYRTRTISASDVRALRCIGPDEEPTEFRCTWRRRSSHGWKRRETWIAIDGKGWRVID
jgi:hypothetical protein